MEQIEDMPKWKNPDDTDMILIRGVSETETSGRGVQLLDPVYLTRFELRAGKDSSRLFLLLRPEFMRFLVDAMNDMREEG